ncbi:MAG: FHA domain-containing protein [Deltaproteobacteria bacterium]|nr:FHA domain-containing protein [Deltaproteobacteria bacterium]
MTIGRHKSCRLSVRREDISRRHAEVSREGSAFFVRDLGSTNGTFVNGEEIGESRRLIPGDRIELGSCTINFCEIDASVNDHDDEDPDSDLTIVSSRPSGREAFNGDLGEIPTYAVLQMLELGNKSGILVLETPDGTGMICFRSGSPVHAETGKLCGFDAALALIGARSGSFRFEPQDVDFESTLECSVTEMLLETCRIEDEQKLED